MTDPVVLERAEGAALALLLAVLLWFSAPPWWLVALVLVLPDLAMLGYALGPRAGAAIYNAAHWMALPILLGMADMFLRPLGQGADLWTQIAVIWLLHIALDRALGYGLKLPTGFRDTRLGRIGRDRP